MAENQTIDIENVFKTVSSGSLDELGKNFFGCGPEEKRRISNSFNRKGETPLMFAIKGDNYDMVCYLVDDLKANIWQLGRFLWKGLDFPQVPPR